MNEKKKEKKKKETNPLILKTRTNNLVSYTDLSAACFHGPIV